MKTIVLLFALSVSLMGCSREKGDDPIARGKGFGYEWRATKMGAVLRVSVKNDAYNEAYVALDGNAKHYELRVGPGRDRYMIVPKGDYEYTAWTFGRLIKGTMFDVLKDDRDGVGGVLVKIRI